MANELEGYRQHLVLAEQEAQRSYDRTLLTLAGGGLGLSFSVATALIERVSIKGSGWLFTTWITWGLALAATLLSFLFSQQALRKAINQVDEEKIYDELVGGWFGRATDVTNYVGGGLLVVGVISFGVFLITNLGG